METSGRRGSGDGVWADLVRPAAAAGTVVAATAAATTTASQAQASQALLRLALNCCWLACGCWARVAGWV